MGSNVYVLKYVKGLILDHFLSLPGIAFQFPSLPVYLTTLKIEKKVEESNPEFYLAGDMNTTMLPRCR